MALDIALRGGAAPRRDVDNLGRDVIRAFSKIFDGSKPDLAAYRVYRQGWPDPDVRVRLMPAVRLAVLAAAMDRARRVLIAERADRMRS